MSSNKLKKYYKKIFNSADLIDIYNFLSKCIENLITKNSEENFNAYKTVLAMIVVANLTKEGENMIPHVTKIILESSINNNIFIQLDHIGISVESIQKNNDDSPASLIPAPSEFFHIVGHYDSIIILLCNDTNFHVKTSKLLLDRICGFETSFYRLVYINTNYTSDKNLSILYFIKNVAFESQISAKLIGCDVLIFESNIHQKFLFPSSQPSGLIELVFEYFSAQIFSFREKYNQETAEICLDIINEFITITFTNTPPAEFFETCVIMFFSAQINNKIPASTYDKFLCLVFNLVNYNLANQTGFDCPWVEIFKGIIFFCCYIEKNSSTMNKSDTLNLLIKTFCLIDLFLCKSHKLLCNSNHYDAMLYELIRNHQSFENLFDFGFSILIS
ncbi:hypothetical protein MXB_2043, partial [Myxobolus squamalis]